MENDTNIAENNSRRIKNYSCVIINKSYFRVQSTTKMTFSFKLLLCLLTAAIADCSLHNGNYNTNNNVNITRYYYNATYNLPPQHPLVYINLIADHNPGTQPHHEAGANRETKAYHEPEAYHKTGGNYDTGVYHEAETRDHVEKATSGPTESYSDAGRPVKYSDATSAAEKPLNYFDTSAAAATDFTVSEVSSKAPDKVLHFGRKTSRNSTLNNKYTNGKIVISRKRPSSKAKNNPNINNIINVNSIGTNINTINDVNSASGISNRNNIDDMIINNKNKLDSNNKLYIGNISATISAHKQTNILNISSDGSNIQNRSNFRNSDNKKPSSSSNTFNRRTSTSNTFNRFTISSQPFTFNTSNIFNIRNPSTSTLFTTNKPAPSKPAPAVNTSPTFNTSTTFNQSNTFNSSPVAASRGVGVRGYRSRFTIEELLQKRFKKRISNDIFMDPCKAGQSCSNDLMSLFVSFGAVPTDLAAMTLCLYLSHLGLGPLVPTMGPAIRSCSNDQRAQPQMTSNDQWSLFVSFGAGPTGLAAMTLCLY